MSAGRVYAAVMLGSALGAVARFGCSVAALELLGPGFPWGSLAVNVVGSFLIGLFAAVTEPGGRIFATPAQRQFLLAGFCGGFTTFSVFSLETLYLVEAGALALAGLNLAVSISAWLLAVWGGHAVGARLNRLQETL
ncbi:MULTISPECIES: CrcB family protein [Luteimonas]|uniref:Fluoride-specific ion channel FluC n=1 Tax=Luteimonas terrae TaxID=1530191 RepID=A0ABU1XRG5_9GAMM|nr:MULTISPECIES: CrcB family protein [Luteimonas]MDR6991978.1 CrcB protein [Luteimonas sp. 3794]MDR7191356.1 CrcB protein [Luteimonas terrae]